MADATQILTFKLVLDGKETKATIELTKKDFEDLNATIGKITERPIIKQFAKDLLLVDASAQEATSGIIDFINYNQVTEKEIQSVIQTLRDEQSVLAVGGQQWQQHGIAIQNLTNAYQSTIMGQKQFTAQSSSARMAVSQFGFALGDASMIMVDFRMFLLSIGNNIPFIVQGLAQVSKEAKDANMSFGQFLKNNLDASMKLVLGANALMFALMVLPSIFNKINEASGDAAGDGLKKLSEELKNMTSGQIVAELEKVRKKIKEINDEKVGYSNIVSSAGSYPVIQMRVSKGDEKNVGEKETVLSEEERKIQDARSKRKLALELEIKDYDKLIDQVKNGADADAKILELRNSQAEKQKELDDLLKTSTEREEDRKRKTEEQKKKYDEYLNSIEKNYALQKELNQINNINNAKNIYDTQQLIEKELQHNLSLEQRLKLLKLQKQTYDDLNEGLNFFDESQADLDQARKDFEEQSVANEKDKLQTNEKRLEVLKQISDLEKKAAVLSQPTEIKKEGMADKQKTDDEIKRWEELYNNGIISKEEFERAKDLIEQAYTRRSLDRDKQTMLEKMNMYGQLIDAWQNALNTMYAAAEQNALNEVDGWKKKEEKKLDEERNTALKHARTQSDRQKINEQYDKKQQQLEDEANKRAHDKLIFWLRLKQLGDIAATTMTTYKAATSALEPPPTGLGPVFGWPLMAAVIAGGLANVALIAQQKVPGYERGGIVVGEKGPEIIAPFQDYASGQSKLIAMTMMTLRDELRNPAVNASLDSDLIAINRELKELLKNIKEDGISARAYLDDREAKKITSKGNYLNNKTRL